MKMLQCVIWPIRDEHAWAVCYDWRQKNKNELFWFTRVHAFIVGLRKMFLSTVVPRRYYHKIGHEHSERQRHEPA